MKILLTGKHGQVGFELQRALAPLGEIVAVDHHDCDLADPAAIRSLVAEVAPQIIVNPAAYTAVDKAESEPELAQAINASAPGILGEEAKKLGALVVHYSTDYVFDGTKAGAYTEDDTPNPQSVYGKTKLAGEQALQASGADHLIFRTSWVYAARGANFAKTMLKLAAERAELRVIADQVGAPTGAELLADVTAHALARVRREPALGGLYHCVAAGETSWHGYASRVVDAARAAGRALAVKSIRAVPTSDYPTPARRPLNSRLSARKLEDTFGLVMPPWQRGVDRMLAEILA